VPASVTAGPDNSLTALALFWHGLIIASELDGRQGGITCSLIRLRRSDGSLWEPAR
jgi:hypothetical protein